MPTPILQVDAFTSEPFRGNPAAVCFLHGPQRDDWMQSVAAEMNLSETAFLLPEGDGYQLRWFTPAVEVDLCGHATLASAHALWESGRLRGDQSARFQTRSGLLTARQVDGWIELDFPSDPPEKCEAPAGLLAALNVKNAAVSRGRFDFLVELDSAAELRELRPDFRALSSVRARGITVTARSDVPEFDFVSRFFAPASGIDEDPVTGSAHCTLAPYWAERLGKSSLVGYQASKRGGIVGVEVKQSRVLLRGKAITVLRGELT